MTMMLIDVVVVADDERDGFPLLLLEKEVLEMGCDLDRFDIVLSSPTCWTVWISRTTRRWRCVHQRWERRHCRCSDVMDAVADDRQRGSQAPLVATIVLPGTDQSIDGSPETLSDGNHAWLPMMVMEHHISVLW
ncbi:hypothetical protein ACLOJK_023341 [Asimina triloba]